MDEEKEGKKELIVWASSPNLKWWPAVVNSFDKDRSFRPTSEPSRSSGGSPTAKKDPSPLFGRLP